jgi:acylpyruvate hydrolase
VRLSAYDDGRGRRPALQRHADDDLIDIASLAALAGDADLTSHCDDVHTIVAAGPDLAARLGELANKHYEQLREQSAVISPAAVQFLPPVARPEKIVCIGLNYHDHVAETGLPMPAEPMFFAKFANSLIGHGATIVPPRVTSQVDYEAELAVVIGRTCFGVSAADALNYVAGVMPLNDVSARDLQLANPLWTGGKAIDTFAPCGPALVLRDEIADTQNLPIKARVNGAVVQDSNTSQMIFSVAELIAFVSRIMTLVPGDIIATGTPAGVARAHGPMTFLNRGDVVEIDITGVGVLRNPIGDPVDAGSAQKQVAGALS